MAGYKHFCMYCGKLIPDNSNVCPFCGLEDPFTYRCPQCRNVIEKGWSQCCGCGLDLHVTCPSCGKQTFVQSACEHCNTPLTVKCPHRKCGYVQVRIGDRCLKCHKKLD